MNDDEKTPPALPGPTLRPASTPGPASVAVDLGSLAQPIRPEALDKGTNVRGWVIVDRLGAGGMGVVYLVKSESDAKDAAALKLSVPVPDESPEAKAERETRFEREAATIVQLRHPNIIKGREFFRWQGHPCLVMPYLTGETLLPYWRKATPSLRVSFRELFWPLADACDYIHAKNIFHRDIKPANIMVQAGHPLLVDFGIARSRAAHTMTGTDILCTPEYTAPEHLLYANSLQRAEEEVYLYTPQADLFCFGATIFECLTGRLPYQHLPTSKAGFMDPRFQTALREFEPLSASECNPAVPASIDQFLGRLMSRDPEARFQTGAEVAAAIDALLEQQDPAFDVPFVPPKRVAAGAPKSNATTADRRRPPTGSPRTPKPPTQPAPPSIVAPSLVESPPAVAASRQESFRPPTAQARARSFADPLPQHAPAAPGEQEAPLPTGFRRAQQLLNASSPAASGQRWLVGGLAAAIVVLLLVVAAVAARTAQPNPTSSLLDSTEKPAPQGAATAMPVTPPSSFVNASPPQPLPTADADAGGLAPPVVVTRSSVAKGKNTDSAAIDALLRNEYGGKRPVVEGEQKPEAPAGPKKPSWLKVTNAPQPTAEEPGKRTFGVPMGTEIAVRLQKPLDSRTVSSGPVVARLMRPLVVRGGVIFSSGTMVYGTASATSAGRFDARFTRLKLADGTEIVFSGIAYDSDDKKPGIRATSRIQGGGGQSTGLGEALVRGTASTLLGKVPGGDAADVARGAGQTVVNHDERSANAASAEALLLDAPADFTVFVATAF